MHKALLAAILAITAMPAMAKAETAVFAGGCFWCVEKDMDALKGVTSTVSGYAGGQSKNPTYDNHEGHLEAVKVEFDPAIIGYDALVARFLRTIDVTDSGGQFCDRGESYKTAIFAVGPEQQTSAEVAVKDANAALGKTVVTPVKPFTAFTDAEDYHQNYYLGKNRILTRFGWIKKSDAYKQYREACGRDARVKQVWGKQAYTDGKAASGS